MLADLLGEWSREEQEWERCWKETGAPPVTARAEEVLVTVHSSFPSSGCRCREVKLLLKITRQNFKNFIVSGPKLIILHFLTFSEA